MDLEQNPRAGSHRAACRKLQSPPPASRVPATARPDAAAVLRDSTESTVGGGGKENENAERGTNSEAAASPFLLHLFHLHKQDPSLFGIRWITPVLYSGILSPFITTVRRKKEQHIHTEDALWKYIALSWSHFGSSYLFLSFSNVGHFHWLRIQSKSVWEVF